MLEMKRICRGRRETIGENHRGKRENMGEEEKMLGKRREYGVKRENVGGENVGEGKNME